MFEPIVAVESVRKMLSFQQRHSRRDRQRAQSGHARVVRGKQEIHVHRTTRSGNSTQRVREIGHCRSDRFAKRRGTLQRAIRKVINYYYN